MKQILGLSSAHHRRTNRAPGYQQHQLYIGGLGCQNRCIWACIGNCLPQNTVECNHLFLSHIPVFAYKPCCYIFECCCYFCERWNFPWIISQNRYVVRIAFACKWCLLSFIVSCQPNSYRPWFGTGSRISCLMTEWTMLGMQIWIPVRHPPSTSHYEIN